MEKSPHITVVIVEDEPLIRSRIKSLLLEHQEVELIAECSNGKEAIYAINSLNPMLVFLDIQLPMFDGFSVLEGLSNDKIPEIIIVSAYDRFAIKAFDYEVVDYILKPFDKNRFDKALNRAKKRILDNDAYSNHLIAKKFNISNIVAVSDIIWFQSNANYVDLFLEGKQFSMRKTLTELELGPILNPKVFRRIHRSHIINVTKVTKFEHIYQGDYRFTMSDGKVLVSSAKYRSNVIYIRNVLQSHP